MVIRIPHEAFAQFEATFLPYLRDAPGNAIAQMSKEENAFAHFVWDVVKLEMSKEFLGDSLDFETLGQNLQFLQTLGFSLCLAHVCFTVFKEQRKAEHSVH